jgi:hypothetical protein
MLIDKFPSINKSARNVLGMSPLEIAMKQGNIEVYKYLMSQAGHAGSVYRSQSKSCYNPANNLKEYYYKPPKRVETVTLPDGKTVQFVREGDSY